MMKPSHTLNARRSTLSTLSTLGTRPTAKLDRIKNRMEKLHQNLKKQMPCPKGPPTVLGPPCEDPPPPEATPEAMITSVGADVDADVPKKADVAEGSNAWVLFFSEEGEKTLEAAGEGANAETPVATGNAEGAKAAENVLPWTRRQLKREVIPVLIHQREKPQSIEDAMMPLTCDDETPAAWGEPQQSIEITTVPLDKIPQMEMPQQAVEDTMSCDETPILSPSAARQVASVSLSDSE